MWTTEVNTHDNTYLFVVRPNALMSNRDAILLFAGVALLSMLIMLRFLIIGAWLVLPFTLLDVIAFGLVLRYISNKNRRKETIHCGLETVTVSRSEGNKYQHWTFQTYWAQVVLIPSRHNWYPSKLFIRSHGRYFEVGSVLTDVERKTLCKKIKNALAALNTGKESTPLND